MRLNEGIRKWAHKRDKRAFGHTEEGKWMEGAS